MGQISIDMPILGQPDSTEEPKIVTAFRTVQTVINGGLDTSNLSPTAGILDTQLGGNPLSSTWTPIASATDQTTGVGGAGVWSDLDRVPFTFTGALAVVPVGRTLQARVHVVGGVNATAPATNLEFGICLVSAWTGASSSQINATLAASASGNTAVVTTPAASASFEAIGLPFTPANNVYMIARRFNSALAANSCVAFQVAVEVRYV